jgi:GMP synthase (glutamine-hydrolysing)
VNCSLKGTVSKDLLNAVAKFSERKVVNFSEFTHDYQIGKDIDAVVISGSAARIVAPEDQGKFQGVANLIRACDLPVFGICFGHQLLAWALGATVGSLKSHFEGFERVRVVCADPVFADFKETQIPLAENHFDYVQKDSLRNAGFKLLADSASCEVEAVKHQSKPFWGVQFHPERISIKGETHPEGHRVIDNFYRAKVKR